MQRECASCGVGYDAKRPNSRYCSDTCRVRANRGDKSGSVPASKGQTVEATRVTLEAAGRESTYLGALALTLAARVDETPGSGAAALAKQLRETMDEALRGTKIAADPLDELKARRDRKLNAG